jgi:hypothetical protein
MREAGYHFDPVSGWPIVTYSASPEKLVELVVKECANIANSLDQHEGPDDCSTAEYMKERFGVK